MEVSPFTYYEVLYIILLFYKYKYRSIFLCFYRLQQHVAVAVEGRHTLARRCEAPQWWGDYPYRSGDQ